MKYLRMDSPTSPGGPRGTRDHGVAIPSGHAPQLDCGAIHEEAALMCVYARPAKNRQEIDGDSIEGRARIGELMRDQKNGVG